MIAGSRQIRVWAFPAPTNMRNSFDGLFAIARLRMERNPLAGYMFLFVARNRKQARVLYWDGTGLIVIAKRLEKGRFNAPWEGDLSKPWCLTPSELSLFLAGGSVT